MLRKWHNQKEIPTPKNRSGKNPKWQLDTCSKITLCRPSEQIFPHRRPLKYQILTKNLKTHIRRKKHKQSTQNITQ